MEKTERQEEMAGHCALVMRGSIACARIRTTVARDVERFYSDKDVKDADARQRDALAGKYECNADCSFQDVCKRLEMVVWRRDLAVLSDELDNRAYHRNERMGVCDAGTDDHEREELEVDAAGERGDDSHGCDAAGDSLGDTCLELWAGAGDLVGRGTYIPGEAYKGRIIVSDLPAKEDAIKFSGIEEKALEDFRKQKDRCSDWLMNIQMLHHQRTEEFIRNKILFILDNYFGYHLLNVYHSEDLITRMSRLGIIMFSIKDSVINDDIYKVNPLSFIIGSFIDFSKIYIYDKNKNISYNLCGQELTDKGILQTIRKNLDHGNVSD